MYTPWWAYVMDIVSSKVITRVINLGFSLLEPQHRQSNPRGTPPKLGWNSGGVSLLSRKPAISLKRGKIGPRLLLMEVAHALSIGAKINDL